MKKKICALSLVFVGISVLFLTINCLAQDAEKEYDLYLYRPLDIGNSCTFKRQKLGGPTETITVSVVSEELVYLQKLKAVEQGNGWVDFYEESPEGLKRYRDIDSAHGIYGVYDPPAIQYPRYIKLGEKYKRISKRTEYNLEDDSLLKVYTEKLSFTLVGIEDVSTSFGEFKDCLKTLADYQLISQDGKPTRKILLSWNVAGVGPVKIISTKLNDGAIEDLSYYELILPEK